MLAALRKFRRPTIPFAVSAAIIIAVPGGLIVAARPDLGSLALRIMAAAFVAAVLGRAIPPRLGHGRRRPPRPASIPAPPQSCPNCRYDLAGIPQRENDVGGIRMTRVVCPECGWAEW